LWTRLVRGAAVEVAYHTRHVFADGLGWLGGRYIIPSPSNYIAKAWLASSAATVSERVNDLLDLEMLEAVDLDERWRWLALSCIRIGSGGD
jgi:hypothetical protein